METVCAETRKLLTPYVRRPPLTDKLLSRPPFRFLHDVIMEIMRATSFFDGLFVEEELNSENVKDREKKIKFLQKIIDVMNIVNDTKLNVKPSKIIAGQEPENTNELLQQIAIALNNKATSSDAVEAVRNEKKSVKKEKQSEKTVKNVTSKKSSRTTDTVKKQKESSISSDVVKKTKEPIVSSKKLTKDKSTNKQTHEAPISTKEKASALKTEKEEPVEIKIDDQDLFGEINIKEDNPNQNEPIISNEQNQTPVIDKIDTPRDENKNIENIESTLYDQRNEANLSKPIKPINLESKTQDNTEIKDIKSDEDIDQIRNKSSAKKKIHPDIETKSQQPKKSPEKIQSDIKTESDQKEVKPQLKPPPARPSSARPGAPRLKENTNVDVIINNTEPLTIGKVNVIVENYDKENQEDDDGGTIVLESGLETSNNEGDIDLIESQKSDHGQLVKQIIETQKVLGNQEANKIEPDWKYETQKDKDASYKEIEALRNRLQLMSKSANPLGKLIDFVREDVEVMRQELLHWRKLKKEVAASLIHQKSLTDKFVTQLQLKIKQMDDQINDQVKLIENVKSNIYNNSLKIKQLTAVD